MALDILSLLAIYSIVFALKYTSLFLSLRESLIKMPFFYKLFDCVYCLGFHAGWIVYLLRFGSGRYGLFNFAELLIWGFGGAVFSLVMYTGLAKLNK